jgi:hypothetical protein
LVNLTLMFHDFAWNQRCSGYLECPQARTQLHATEKLNSQEILMRMYNQLRPNAKEFEVREENITMGLTQN